MALAKWEPWQGLASFRRELDRLFDEFGGPSLMRWEQSFAPEVEVSDTKDAVVVKALVPGITKENLHVDITDDALTLKGEMKQEEKKEDTHYYQREFRYGAFTRTISLPVAVQSDKAKAEMKDGVLQITIPKNEKAKAKAVPIKVS
jgi:HSP20 family protein